MTWGRVTILTQGLFKVIGRNISYFVFLWRNIRSSYLNKDCMRFENMSWSWPKIICARSRSLSKDVNTLTRLYMYIELENDMNENLTQRLSGTELRPELELLSFVQLIRRKKWCTCSTFQLRNTWVIFFKWRVSFDNLLKVTPAKIILNYIPLLYVALIDLTWVLYLTIMNDKKITIVCYEIFSHEIHILILTYSKSFYRTLWWWDDETNEQFYKRSWKWHAWVLHWYE